MLKIYEKINRLHDKVCEVHSYISDKFYEQYQQCNKIEDTVKSESASVKSKLDKMSNTIESQQRTIEQLTNALKDKYEHGLFIFSEDCKMPMVIRNGEELTNQLTSCFSICW